MTDRKTTNDERDALSAEIERLESEGTGASVSLPKVTLDELTYTAPSDEQLLSAARSELEEYKTSNENSLREDSDLSRRDLESKRNEYERNRQSDSARLKASYEASARAIDNDVVKRGLARSSIAATERGALERDYLAQTADIVQKYGSSIAAIDADIAAVDVKLKQALNDFNLSYAAKLNKRLAELKSERDKKVADVIEFNNNVRKNQAQLDRERAKAESSLSEAADREAVYKTVFEKMDAFLGAMDPVDALVELRNHTMYRDHLSDYYYNKLLDKYGRANR